MHAPILHTLLKERDEHAQRAAELETENIALRGYIAESDAPCLYCRLPKALMPECKSGFPGCGRMDDLMNSPKER